MLSIKSRVVEASQVQIIVNPCGSQSENYMSYVKKSQLFKKKYKIENRSGGRLKNKFLKSKSILSTFLHCDQKNSIFFKKLRFFYIVIPLDIFFEIHNPNEKLLEISVFENSIIRWVYKVVKEALKKSEKFT